jgi:hypothetical protein
MKENSKKYRPDVPIIFRMESGFFDQKIFELCEQRMDMSKKDKNKEVQKETKKEVSGDSSSNDRSCCYVVDRCGCYVDPC